ncbi:MAG: hypothetical protein QM775_16635 [Pirellulales bacterium]
MSSDKPAASGDVMKFTALEFNALRALARRSLREATRRRRSDEKPDDTNVIDVRNESNENLGVGAIVGLTRKNSSVGPVQHTGPNLNLAEFRKRPCLKARVPVAPPGDITAPFRNDIGQFGVLLEPLRPNAIGPAQVSGVAVVKIEMSDSGHPYADVLNGDATKLRSGEVGAAQILWVDGQLDGNFDLGEKMAVVRLGNFHAPTLFAEVVDDSLFPHECKIVDLGYGTVRGTGRQVFAHPRTFYPNGVSNGDRVILEYNRFSDQFFIVGMIDDYFPGYS